MSSNDAFDRQVRDWLSAEGQRTVPPGLAEAAVATTANRHPRPAWLVAALGAGYGGSPAAPRRALFDRPMAVVLLAALLVLAIVAGIVAFGSSRPLLVVTASLGPSSSALVAVASPTLAPSPTSAPSLTMGCPTTGGAWPAPSTPPGPIADAKPGLLAGWGQVGTRNDGQPIFDVFTFDPFQESGPGALRRVTTLELSSAKESVLDWSPDGSALDVDWSSGTTASGCTETFVVVGGNLYRPFPEHGTDFFDGPVWSSDGSRLADVEYHGDFTQPIGNVAIRNRDGTSPLALPIICPRCQPFSVKWSPDGTILAAGYETIAVDGSSGPLGVAFYPFATGQWEIHPFSGVGFAILGWLDDERLLVDQSSAKGTFLVTVSPLVKGELRVGTGSGTLAPDRHTVLIDAAEKPGSSLAVLSVLDLATGITRPLSAGGPWPELDAIVWAPDESAVVLGVFDPQPAPALGNRTGTWLVPLDGSAARQLTGPEFSPSSWQPVWPAP
jgi:hypothetical protein